MRAGPSRSRRRWWWIVVGILVAVAVVGGGTVAYLWGGRGAHEVPVDRAVDEFRRVPSRTDTSFMQPTAGVYTYTGRGTERLSLLGAQQLWGSRIPGTVTATAPSCWTFRVEYNDHRSQELDFCARPTGLVVTSGRVTQRFEFRGFTVEDTNEFRLPAPWSDGRHPRRGRNLLGELVHEPQRGARTHDDLHRPVHLPRASSPLARAARPRGVRLPSGTVTARRPVRS